MIHVAALRLRSILRYSRRLLALWRRGRWPEGWRSDDRRNLLLWLGWRRRSRARCPICGFVGPFLFHAGRPRQVCPSCGSRARHRAIERVLRHVATGRRARWGLYLAPEACLAKRFDRMAERVLRADLEPSRPVSLCFDLCRTPFADQTFDLAMANHVMEHIVEDRRALAELFRILRPGGRAVLTVPVTAAATLEFGEARPEENDHARECGEDYFDRYRQAGFEVTIHRSDELPTCQEEALVTEPADPRRAVVVHHVGICCKPDGGRHGD